MVWQLWVTCFVLFLAICLFLLPFVFEVRLSFNPVYNRGVISLQVFNINVGYKILSFEPKGVIIQDDKDQKQKMLNFSDQNFEVTKTFLIQIIDKMKLKKLLVFYNIGIGDAFSTAMMCGVVNQIFLQSFIFLKSKKPTASFGLFDTISYNRNIGEVAFRVQISITIFDMIYSFVFAFIKNNIHKVV